MTRALIALALLTGCATQTPAADVFGEGGAPAAGTLVDPAPTPIWMRPGGSAHASRSVRQDRRSLAGPAGTPLSSTAYCETGLMANGRHTHPGAVAGNAWPLGTKLRISNSPYGPGTFTVEDRIGHGSQLDFAIPGDCTAARRWGRRTITVEVAA